MRVASFRECVLAGLATLALAQPVFARDTFVVNTSDDRGGDSYRQDRICDTRNDPTASPPRAPSGVCTLRAAIEQANWTPGRDTILVRTAILTVTTIPLPTVTGEIVILPVGTTRTVLDGSQVGTVGDGLALRGGNSEVRNFVIRRFDGDGISLSRGGGNTLANLDVRDNRGDGIQINNSANNQIGGRAPRRSNLIIGNFRAGIRIVGAGSTGNTIEGNFIGTNRAGTTMSGNQDGVVIVNAANNVIGGTTRDLRNIISGNRGNGVWITGATSRLNIIIGNLIGLGSNGLLRLSNTQDGIHISDGAMNRIGGAAAAHRNVVSGNGGDGIQIQRAAADSNEVRGNYIGTDSTGLTAVPNVGMGIFITGASSTFIGGTAQGERNVISGNGSFGISVQGAGSDHTIIENNLIGLAANGNDPLGNGDDGVFLTSSADNVIGGTNDFSLGVRRGNVISNNRGDGIQIDGTSSQRNQILGNYIGTNEVGSTARANTGNGIFVSNAPNNTIGGALNPSAGLSPGNVIAANGGDGIEIARLGATNNEILGNLIGVDAGGLIDMGNTGMGVLISNAPGNTVGGENQPALNLIRRNVISGNELDGIQIRGPTARDNKILGNYIGLDQTGRSLPQGTPALPAGQRDGVFISRAPDNTVGGPTAGFRNVIAGNAGRGVTISGSDASGNTVVGNYIGTDEAGVQAIGNGGAGVLINQADSNRVGAATARPGEGPGNVISGNWTSRRRTAPFASPVGGAVHIQGDTAQGNLVQGNLIGLQSDGTSALPNRSAGVLITGNAAHNSIGGTAANLANRIAHNLRGGVIVESGIGNSILSNSMRGNTVAAIAGVVPRPLGIDLVRDGLTANDRLDRDGGANDRQNFPEVLSDRQGAPHVDLRLRSLPSMLYDVQLFSSRTAHPTGFGEGDSLLATQRVTTDANGQAEFRIATPYVAGQFLTATATDTTRSTSEFACVAGSIDLDVDSDNTSSFVATGPPNTANYGPARNTAEDQMENDTLFPGRFVLVNDGDDDANGIADWRDGFGAAANAQERDFVRVTLEIARPVDLALARVRFSYARSDPRAPAGAGAPPAGTLRIWTRAGNRLRQPAAVPGGHFVDTLAAYTPADLGVGASREAVLWVEAVRPSTRRGGNQIIVSMDPDGPAAASAGFDCTDIARVSAVSLQTLAGVGAPPAANRPLPLGEAHGVSNYVTTNTLPAAAVFAAGNADPENFRLEVIDPNAVPARDSVRVEVIRGNRTIRGPFTYGLTSRLADTLRTIYIRPVSDTVDDAVPVPADPRQQTVWVSLGDTVRTTYVPLGGSVRGLTKDRLVARPVADNNNTLNERLHDIRRLRLNVIVFRNAAGTAPVATRAAVDSAMDVIGERMAQAGIQIDVRGVNMGGAGSPGVALPVGAGIAWGDGFDAVTAVVGGALHAEEAAIFALKDADVNSIDIFFTPDLSAAAQALVGARARSYPAFLASPNPSFRNNVVATAHRGPLSLGHEVMHILLNAGHRGGEPATSLFRGGTTLNIVGGTKRIGPYPGAGVANADVTTIRRVAEILP
ncbi:MAG: hypothetical protein BMS9Abin29_1384 [Gemmatimonadota bacterium]|nr:MAG: hypothetical protein BMS9Abin29_1384 [Gemmatimonadota bacterium]